MEFARNVLLSTAMCVPLTPQTQIAPTALKVSTIIRNIRNALNVQQIVNTVHHRSYAQNAITLTIGIRQAQHVFHVVRKGLSLSTVQCALHMISFVGCVMMDILHMREIVSLTVLVGRAAISARGGSVPFARYIMDIISMVISVLSVGIYMGTSVSIVIRLIAGLV